MCKLCRFSLRWSHILLPLTIHSMTRSKKAVALLNQLVYGIVYTELEAQTAMAEHHLKKTSEGEALIPFNIDPSCRVCVLTTMTFVKRL